MTVVTVFFNSTRTREKNNRGRDTKYIDEMRKNRHNNHSTHLAIKIVEKTALKFHIMLKITSNMFKNDVTVFVTVFEKTITLEEKPSHAAPLGAEMWRK